MNKEKEIDLTYLFKVVISKWRKLLKLAAIGGVIGVVVAVSIPKEYTAYVKMTSDDQTGSSSLSMAMKTLGGNMASETDGNVINFTIYPEVILSTTFLIDFITLEVPYNGTHISLYDYINNENSRPWWSYIAAAPTKVITFASSMLSNHDGGTPQTDTVNNFSLTKSQNNFIGILKQRIQPNVDKETGILSITTTMQDPVIAAIMADSLTSRFQQYVIKYRTAKARNNYNLSKIQYDAAQMAYYKADSLYAATADRNQGTMTNSSRIKIERLNNEKMVALNTYQQSKMQILIDESKIQNTIPNIVIIEKPRVPLTASKPRRAIIVAGWAFMFAFGYAALLVGKILFKKKEDLDTESEI